MKVGVVVEVVGYSWKIGLRLGYCNGSEMEVKYEL